MCILMDMDSSSSAAPENQASVQIPFDLFVSKKHQGLGLGLGGGRNLRFTDASRNLVFRVDRQSHNSTTLSHRKRRLLDASGNPLFSIHLDHNGSWQGFRGDNSGEALIFRVERTLNTLTRTDFDIFLLGETCQDSKSEFKMKGCPFQRSCTIYRGNSIVAQTSLMYKIGIWKIFVSKRRFRLTIFPGFADHALVVALIVIFFDGHKLWI